MAEFLIGAGALALAPLGVLIIGVRGAVRLVRLRRAGARSSVTKINR